MRVAAAQGEPFADDAVRRLRTMGALLLGWELLEPVMWLFLKARRRGTTARRASDRPGGCSSARWSRVGPT